MEKLYTIYAPAKINLYLHINDKLPNGYHNIESLITFVNIFDTLEITDSSSYNLTIKGEFAQTLINSTDLEHNLITKVVSYLKNRFKISSNLNITLTKNIPLAAGLAGGSSDAAAVLKLLNKVWQLNLSPIELFNIATEFGSDVGACMVGTSGIISNVGDKFKTVNIPVNLPILIINNLQPVSTQQVYQNTIIPVADNLIQSFPSKLEWNSFFNTLNQTSNHLTPAATKLNNSIKTILQRLEATSPMIARMSGSGSSCFAIYASMKQLNSGYESLAKEFPSYYLKKAYNIS